MNRQNSKKYTQAELKKNIPYIPFLVNIYDIENIKSLCRNLWGNQGIYSKEFYIKLLEDSLSYVYKEKKEIIAICLVGKQEKRGFIDIDVLAVKRGYRGKGLGKSLLSYCIDNCMKKGFNIFQLHVATSNEIAIHLYEKLGFKIVGRPIKNYYCNDPEGQKDAYLMILNKNNELKEIQNNQFKSEDKEKIKKNEIKAQNSYKTNLNYSNWNKKNEGIDHQVIFV